jgi:hypothetical protein
VSAGNRVAQVFCELHPETSKHVVISVKQKIIRVENVKDNDEDVNQFDATIHQSNEHQIHRKILCQNSYILYAKRWQ